MGDLQRRRFTSAQALMIRLSVSSRPNQRSPMRFRQYLLLASTWCTRSSSADIDLLSFGS